MDFFEYKNGELFAEDVPVERIAREVGTPAYIYSLATLRRHFRVFDQAFKKQSHLVCFSVKANSIRVSWMAPSVILPMRLN